MKVFKIIVKVSVLVWFIVSAVGCNNPVKLKDNPKKHLTNIAQLVFEKDTLSLGDIKQGKIILMKFPFYNSGKEPLILFDVRTSCGCTAADWPRKPVKVGATDALTVKFDSSNRKGDQQKLITVFSNSSECVKMLVFRGNVKE